MIGRTLRVLVAPGVPFQKEPVQAMLSKLRGSLQVQVYDCHSAGEAFDSLTSFWPDAILWDTTAGEFHPKSLQSLGRRLIELRSDDIPDLFLLSDNPREHRINGWGKVQSMGWEDIGAEAIARRLMSRATPRAVDRAFTDPNWPETTQNLHTAQYEWMGRTTLTEEGATRSLYAEERFRNLVNNALDLTCVVESDGFIKYASASSLMILGLAPDYLAGRYVQDFFPKCKQSHIIRWFGRNKDRTGFAEIRTRHANGNHVYLEAACTDMTADPAVRGFVINARDISARREAEGKLSYQARLLAHIREAVIGIGQGGHIAYMNPAAERMYRHKVGEGQSLHWNELFQVEYLHLDEEEFLLESLKDHGRWQGEVIQHLPSGRRIHAEVSCTAHQEAEEEGLSYTVVIRDIRDRKVVENVLHESENRYRHLVSLTSDLIWHSDESHNLTFISPKVSQLLGFTSAELTGKPLTALMADPSPRTNAALARAILTREPFSYLQGTFITKDGRVKYLEVSGLPQMGPKRQHVGFNGAIRDVTERVEAEQAIRQSLAEKETLIKEIHHRVKNNMQIVSSLLYLQTQFVKDPDMLARLQESQDRIRSMALVHEKLYQSTDLSHIDFKDYLETLARHISNSYRNRFVHLSLEMPEEPVSIGIDTAVPCGLIVNELVSNAYKHAFKDGGKGIVTVRLSAKRKNAVLAIIDTGPGLPTLDIASYEATSLGMQLVGALVHQLQGKLSVENKPGASFCLQFRLD